MIKKVLILAIVFFFSFNLMVRKDSGNLLKVRASLYSIPLTMARVDADFLIHDCKECRMKHIILDEYPGIKKFYRDVFLLEKDSVLTAMTWAEFNGNILIETEIDNELKIIQIDSNSFIYYSNGKFFKLNESNKFALKSLFCIF